VVSELATPQQGSLLWTEPSNQGESCSLNMLTEEGFFSAADYVGWLQEVGFHEMRVESLTYEQSMIVGFK